MSNKNVVFQIGSGNNGSVRTKLIGTPCHKCKKPFKLLDFVQTAGGHHNLRHYHEKCFEMLFHD